MSRQLTFEGYRAVEALRDKRMCRHCRYFVIDRFGHFHCFKRMCFMDLDSRRDCGHFNRRENWLSIDDHFNGKPYI